MNNVIQVDFHRRTVIGTLAIQAPRAAVVDEGVSFRTACNWLRARYSDMGLPSYVEEAWSKKAVEPYAFGCVHNIEWSPIRRDAIQLGRWNRPMPYPMDVAKGVRVIGKEVALGG